MIYIIDANNLAGSMDMLGEEDFDKKLTNLIIEFLKNKNNMAFLVFDSADPYGDKVVYDNVEAIYAPRKEGGDSADDKILEILKKQNRIDEIILVTDDIDLKNKANKIALEKLDNFKIEKTKKFIFKLDKKFKNDIIDIEDRGLSEEQENNINSELLNIWK